MGYSVNELCEIIKTCRKYGVADVQIADLKLQFASHDPQSPEARPVRLTKEQKAKAEAIERENFEDNEARIREEQLEYLKLSDPLAYEELIARGELGDVGEESDEIGS